MNMRYVLGTVTILAIVGGTIYAIKKSKDADKIEESAISVEEAKAMVEASKQKAREELTRPLSKDELDGYLVTSDMVDKHGNKHGRIVTSVRQTRLTEDEMEEVVDDAREMADYNTSFMRKPSEEDELLEPEDEDEDYSFYDGLDFQQPLVNTMKEEDRELRHDPNSIDAREQFIKMELAEWVPLEETYQIMIKLFDFPFEPKNDGDGDLFTKLVDYRAQFFGFNSKWIRKVTYADVILHFARLAVFNLGDDMRHWVGYFLDFNEIMEDSSSREVDEVLNLLNNHVYFNEERASFGLFGLTRQSMDQALRIANGNVDRSVTYEIEFNEFLKSAL